MSFDENVHFLFSFSKKTLFAVYNNLILYINIVLLYFFTKKVLKNLLKSSKSDEWKELCIDSWLELRGEISSKALRAKGDVGRQGEGGYPQKARFGETSFMDGPLENYLKAKKTKS